MFVLFIVESFTQIASSARQMTGSQPNLHNTVPTRACIQGMLKVKGHVKRPLLCLLYSIFWRSVSTCTHFTKHHYTLLPV